jgi:regulator of replication initiation timing
MTIPETQADPEPDPMDISESIEVDEIPESMPPPPRPSARRAQQQPRAPRAGSAGLRRAGSASDTERDPVLRRKVGELTKKLEAMTTKYDNLKEVATSSKESNFEAMKKRTDQTVKDQDAVVKALKQQLDEMQSRSSELAGLKKDMVKLEKENARLVAENSKLNSSLTTQQNENKTLSTKLAAARSSAPPENKNVPGSAVKNRNAGVVLPGTASAAKDAQTQQLKIDLYSDLTNLVVVGVKKGEEGEDVYDCLQTGRNGSKSSHFTIYNLKPAVRLTTTQHSTSCSQSTPVKTAVSTTPNSSTAHNSMSNATENCSTSYPTT